MKSNKSHLSEKKLALLADGIGDFISYWGFRRIHGQIWTLVYLSQNEMSSLEIQKTLKVSKALTSTGLNELVKHKLIFLTSPKNQRLKTYAANPEVIAVIYSILKTRELKMLEKISSRFNDFKPTTHESKLDPKRITSLEAMIALAQFSLTSTLENCELESFLNLMVGNKNEK